MAGPCGAQEFPCWWERPREGSPGVGAAQAKVQGESRAQVWRQSCSLPTPPLPLTRSLPVGSCCEKLCDQELATGARGKRPSAALSQGAMAGTYPVSWPLEVAVTLKRCFVPLPRSSQRDGALLPKASCTDTLTSHMHG